MQREQIVIYSGLDALWPVRATTDALLAAAQPKVSE
eukprot:SAG31_NODE_717_length_12611_cov_25.933104_3_plen_36_part_00